MNELVTETGYMIKGPNGYVAGSGGSRTTGWATFKTKRNAERRIRNRPGYSVIRAKITITEEPMP